jgi:hypothetical protein
VSLDKQLRTRYVNFINLHLLLLALLLEVSGVLSGSHSMI